MALDAKKLERTLEEHAARLPVDTPLDRRRRRRRTSRAGRGAVALLVVAAVGALVWRRLRAGTTEERVSDAPGGAGPAPDTVGAAVDRAEPVAATLP